jgi:hypothetical protein
MYRPTLRTALLVLAALAASSPPADAAPACPRADAPVTERFTSADCADCWAAAVPGSAADGWLFDWITPTPRAAEAALASAAPIESAERAQRLGAQAPVDSQVWVQRERLQRSPGLKLQVQSGPAWNGYFGLQLDARGALPAGSTGWLALVEMLPAGTEGTKVDRQLLRSVAGPFPLDGARSARGVRHLRALRWPDTAQPARLQARGWIEGPDGRLLAVASDSCAWR